MFDFRLVMCDPNGTRQGVINDVLNPTITLVDSSTATISFSVQREFTDIPNEAFVVGVEYSTDGGGSWWAPRNDLFIVTQDNRDNVKVADTVKLSGVSYVSWLMGRALLAWSGSAVNGERLWLGPGKSAVSAGYIVAGMLSEAKARGWGPTVTYDFNGNTDSLGTAWVADDKVKQSFQVLTPITQALSSLAEQGLCDWWTEGMKLRLTRGGTGSNLVQEVTLGGDAFVAAPRRTSADELFTHLTVVPEKARNWLYLTNSGADGRFGRLEATMTQSGVADTATATRLAQPTLVAGRTPLNEWTYTWNPTAGTPMPFADFNVGDNVSVLGRVSVPVPLRVVGLVLSRDGDGVVTVDAVVGAKLLTQQARRARRTDSATVGGTANGAVGGSGVALPAGKPRPYPKPVPPAGLTLVSNTGYFAEDGSARAKVKVSWPAVVSAEEGGEITSALYEVWSRVPPASGSRATATIETEVTLDLPAGVAHALRVRAQTDDAVWGDFSAELTVTAAAPPVDATPPTPPVLTGEMGTVSAAWDGQLTTGVPPAGFRHVVTEAASAFAGSYTQVGQTLARRGSSTWPVEIGATRWVRFVAVDRLGRRSNPSSSVQVTVQGVVDDAITDAIEEALGAANRAQSTADGKATISPNAPTVADGAGKPVGALWWRRDSSDQVIGMWEWSGSAWASRPLGPGAIAASAVTAAKLADGAVTSAKLGLKAVTPEALSQAVADSISTAQATAANAQSVASGAQSTADAAASAAAAASGIASGKADVLIQDATPPVSMRKDTTLWIDTSGGVNTPRRWSGTGWAAVTDKAATDAARAAADAAVIAGAAQSAASAAQSAAASAAAAAAAAQTTADGKNRVVRSSSAASDASSYRAGDQWWRYSGSQIIGMWIHSGSEWVSQTLTDSVITNLNAGTITSGSIAAERIAANTITGTHIAGATVTAANMVAGTITAASGILANAAVGTANIQEAAITGAKIADATITDAKIANLNAGKITAGELNGALLKAGSVSAQSVLVSDYTNLVDGSDFEDPAKVPWNIASSSFTLSTTTPRSGSWRLNIAPGSTHRAARTFRNYDVQEGEQFYIEMYATRTTAYDGTATNSKLAVRKASDNAQLFAVSFGLPDLPTANTWTKLSGVFTVPAGVTSVYFELRADHAAGLVAVDDITFRRRAAGELIVDGAVTTRTLAADAVKAANLDAGAVKGRHMAVGVGESGQRVEIVGTGITVFDADNTPTIRLGTAADDVLSIAKKNASGELVTVASIDEAGAASFTSVDVAGDVTFPSGRLVGVAGELTYNGQYVDTPLLERAPVGVIWAASLGEDSGSGRMYVDGSTASALALGIGSVNLNPGRIYTIGFDRTIFANWQSGSSSSSLVLELWIGPGTQSVTAPNGVVARFPLLEAADASGVMRLTPASTSGLLRGLSGQNNVLARVVNPSNRPARFYTIDAPPNIVLRDEGPDVDAFDGGVIYTRASTGNVTPPVTRVARTVVFNATWSVLWGPSGSIRPAGSSLYDDGRMLQGGNSGARAGQVGFPALGLAGKTITGVWLRLRNRHTSSNSGATVDIGTHGNASPPSGGSPNNVNTFTAGFAKGQERWVPVPSSLWSAIASGSIRGFQIGGPNVNSGSSDYGIFDGYSTSNAAGSAIRPQLKVSYKG